MAWRGLSGADGSLLLRAVYEATCRDAQSLRESQHRREARVAEAAFHSADLSDVDSGSVRNGILG